MAEANVSFIIRAETPGLVPYLDREGRVRDGLPVGFIQQCPMDRDSVANLCRHRGLYRDVGVSHDPDGGVYRSDDAGESWTRVSRDRRLRQRHWYYSHIVADPADENTVYAMNKSIYRSIDAGKSWETIRVPHGDVQDLWVNPQNPDFMVVANDGGAQVSLNAGESWSTLLNQPTAELYRVVTDDRFPYRLYAAQQDNSTISLPSRSSGGLTPYEEWYDVGGCESGHIAVDPEEGGPSRLVIYAVPEPDHSLDAGELKPVMQKEIASHLNPLFRVHDVVLIDGLPRTASNKVMRRVLRDRYEESRRT